MSNMPTINDSSSVSASSIPPLKIAMVAGEASGDILAAGLIREIKRHHPNAHCYGIGGPLMIAEGFESLFPMERLSVMGLVEVLGRLKELIGIRRQLKDRLISDQPDIFVGIDAPDFNLGLEKQLKKAGIPTMHYVSPQVWAWREGRVKTIRERIDEMLVLFEFETDVTLAFGKCSAIHSDREPQPQPISSTRMPSWMSARSHVICRAFASAWSRSRVSGVQKHELYLRCLPRTSE